MPGKHIFSAVLFLSFLFVSSQVMAVNIQYSYDKNGRLTETAYAKNRISYQYDLNGNLLGYDVGSLFFWLMFLPALNQGSRQAGSTPLIGTKSIIKPPVRSGSTK